MNKQVQDMTYLVKQDTGGGRGSTQRVAARVTVVQRTGKIKQGQRGAEWVEAHKMGRGHDTG